MLTGRLSVSDGAADFPVGALHHDRGGQQRSPGRPPALQEQEVQNELLHHAPRRRSGCEAVEKESSSEIQAMVAELPESEEEELSSVAEAVEKESSPEIQAMVAELPESEEEELSLVAEAVEKESSSEIRAMVAELSDEETSTPKDTSLFIDDAVTRKNEKFPHTSRRKTRKGNFPKKNE
ncbi:unnamed protein product [Larinioides sclopetarius]|uniref:Uncharacterized protein n=1 Tax=Larinioides sclopetarius TaxID=280406 RepID=A0AAV2B2E8_9ARAC